jgi:hypothetical protein
MQNLVFMKSEAIWFGMDAMFSTCCFATKSGLWFEIKIAGEEVEPIGQNQKRRNNFTGKFWERLEP